VPANFLVEDLQCIPAIIVRGLQGCDRVEEHAQRLGGIGTTVHVPLLLAVIGLREQPSHQLDEHRDRIIGELLSKLYDLCNDQGVPATCVEVVGQPCRSCVALTDHLIPPSRRYARLHFRIDPQPTQKPDPFGQSDQVRRARRFWRRP